MSIMKTQQYNLAIIPASLCLHTVELFTNAWHLRLIDHEVPFKTVTL